MDILFTPIGKGQLARIQRPKRFTRKPVQRSERSSSRRSIDQSVKQMYIKSPASINKQKVKEIDFFASLASSLMTTVTQTRQLERQVHKQETTIKYKCRNSERGNDILTCRKYSEKQSYGYIEVHQQSQNKNYKAKIKTLQAEVELKNHELVVISGQIQRFKNQLQQQKQKRKKAEQQKKQTSRELKQMIKINEKLKIQVKKHQKQKEHITKQIQFLERINFDQKTRNLQSYRQKYLEGEIQKMKKHIQQKKEQREGELQKHINQLKQQKFTLQSHFKAIKVANQCLIKQLNQNQDNMHEIILNSEQYKKLREKYVRFLEQYKLLRNQYWALKAETTKKNVGYDSSSLFSISASEVESDLTIFKNSLENSNLNISVSLGQIKNVNEKGKCRSGESASKKFQASRSNK